MPPNAEDFRNALHRILAQAEEAGGGHMEVVSLDLHRAAGYDSSDHRMPNCCRVMLAEVQEGRDEILHSPDNPQRASSTLEIRYQLPRA